MQLRFSKLAILTAMIGGAAVIGTAAAAADLGPINKAPPAPPPMFSWTGFYVGGSAGVAVTTSDVGLGVVDNNVFFGVPLYDPVAHIPGLVALGSPSITQSNGIIGAKAGYNQQWGSLVVGLEGDYSSFHFNKTQVTTGNPFGPGFGNFATFSTDVSTTWLATVRPRIGYAVDRMMVYATGGVAFGNVSLFDTYVAHSPNGAGNDSGATAGSQTKTGWAAGAGFDFAVVPNVILSVEYLHVDLGTMNASGLVTTQFNPLTATFNFSANLHSDIVRAGAAYKF